MLSGYIPIIIIIILAIALAAAMLGLSAVLGPRRDSRRKLSPYESGIPPTGDTRGQFSIKYYLVGALFILFDVEAVFLFAWAVVYKDLGLLAFVEIIVFLIIILGGYFYIVKKGALEWE
ncbi:MAG: NADH-quinone oxidoreductase subunit A [Candidatus Dadabacteria bacterium]|nr:NADH-quinone oxidoreductase subunit A [Candidatus Dadabacteria bacterium]